MASLDECHDALEVLAKRLAAVDKTKHKKNIPDRSMSLTLLDHDVEFRGRLHDGELRDIERVEPGGPKADVRLTMSSDDLIALTNKELSFAHAWATGRVHLDASFRDLLRLRSFG